MQVNKSKPTIEELEQILANDEKAEIHVNPDGSIFVNREMDRLKEQVTQLQSVVDKCECALEHATVYLREYPGTPKHVTPLINEAIQACRAAKGNKPK